ncbi:hypothetical protein [Shewanella litorisediminis]|nr:hypothetical protein [Shewanella litorisediminis]
MANLVVEIMYSKKQDNGCSPGCVLLVSAAVLPDATKVTPGMAQ